jgi:hypothetical protein
MRSPTTFGEAAQFLSNIIFSDFAQQFDDSCNFIAQNFSCLSSTDFSNLTNKALEKILFLESLRLPSENFLLEKILECPQKIHLIKFVIFPAVDYDLLMHFIPNLNFSEVQMNSIVNLIKIFNFTQINIPTQRWNTIPTFLSLDQLRDIVFLLNSLSQENQRPIENLLEIKFNYEEFEIQKFFLQKVRLLEEEIRNLKKNSKISLKE